MTIMPYRSRARRRRRKGFGRRPFSVDEIFALVEAGYIGEHELIGGEVVPMAAKGIRLPAKNQHNRQRHPGANILRPGAYSLPEIQVLCAGPIRNKTDVTASWPRVDPESPLSGVRGDNLKL